jgi:transcriptional regulator with GAF, ATPase, and Fis domain
MPAMVISFYGVEADNYHAEHIALLQPLTQLISEVIDSIQKESAVSEQLISPALQNKAETPAFKHIIGASPKLLAALDQVNQVAAFDASVLVLGETGVGKEGLVKALHLLSPRKAKPFIRINCAAIPASLVESELFGHERGAFTGAIERRIGKFEQAQGGTIFLDEIGEMPLEVQSKLLRVIQEKELERVGGRSTIKVDVRIVAATNRDLYKEVAAGKFRIDLYYRINVFPITLAPLRERKEDIPLLAEYFLNNQSGLYGSVKKLGPGAIAQLMQYSWPGNIRELQHVLERHALLNTSGLISTIDLPEEETIAADFEAPLVFQSIAEIDKAHITEALKKCNGKVSGRGGAAELLKIPSTTLASKMKRLGITWGYLTD